MCYVFFLLERIRNYASSSTTYGFETTIGQYLYFHTKCFLFEGIIKRYVREFKRFIPL